MYVSSFTYNLIFNFKYGKSIELACPSAYSTARLLRVKRGKDKTKSLNNQNKKGNIFIFRIFFGLRRVRDNIFSE